MATINPHHAVLFSLLERNQFDACRMAVEDLIAREMDAAQPSDRELAALHLLLCRALMGQEHYAAAALKAEFAALEARKAKAPELLAEALYRSGLCYGQSHNHPAAIERLTECLQWATGKSRASALYNRGHAHEQQRSYSKAAADYEAALATSADLNPRLVRTCRANLAWVLIMQREFDQAEGVLAELAREADAASDEALQLQIADDRLHMAHLAGRDKDAFNQAAAALLRANKQFPHIRARILLTLMTMAAERDLPEQGFALGLLAKRLAAKARRPDIDDEAGRRMQELEFHAGSGPLANVLLRMREIGHASVRPRKGSRRGSETGGAG